MIFKSSTVALVVTSAFALNANADDVNQAVEQLSTNSVTLNEVNNTKDIKGAFRVVSENVGVYLIHLSEKSGLDTQYSSLGDDRSSVLAKIDKQQEAVLENIRSLDSSAVLTYKARLTENALYVQMSHKAAKELSTNSNIVAVELLSEEPSYTEEDEFKRFPFLKINDPGDAITVAIVGNGIDYTHEALGGTGTTEAYDKAWANRSNAWDGFPTDTVIGGLDFSAAGEGYHSIDYNPIEEQRDPNVDTGVIPSGTVVASQILAQAPDAKILYYKTWDWASAYFYPALDVIVDPNQDGDISDRPDVIVLNSYGNAAFYVENDTQGSQATRDIGLVRRLSATGSLLVVGAGKTYYSSYFNLAWRAAVPEALTVGSVSIDGDNIQLSEFTPAGPTRGTQMLKPDVVGPAENVTGPVAGSGMEQEVFIAHPSYAAAYAAGTAAKILEQYPQLSPIEAKALVANTALADGIQGGTTFNEEFERSLTTVAEVPFMGTGLVDGATAITANSVIWETSSYQPSLAFGYVEASTSMSASRDITIKNLTDQVQTYKVSTKTNGNKVSNEAVSFIYPEVINVPANHSVVFTVTMSVDAEKLADWPLKKTEDYTIEKWTEAAINGYLVFDNSDENSAQLKMPWQVFPKSKKRMTKANSDVSGGLPYDAPRFMELLSASGGWVESNSIDVTNNTNKTKSIHTIPLMHNVPVKAPSKAGGQGNLIENIGATIAADAMCESGSKLTVAVQMFDKFDLPMAEHFDKAGHLLTYFTAYDKDIADLYENKPLDLERNSTEADKLAYFEIAMNNDGKPVLEYIDFSMEHEWWNPRKRFKQSTFEVDVAPGGDTVVASICIDDLYHHDFQSVDAWDETLGWQFATDRDAQSSVAGPVIRYNPVINGLNFIEVIDHTGEYNYPPYTYQYCDPNGTDWSGNPRPADYCLEEKATFLAHTTGVAKITENEDDQVWSNHVELAPGESATVSSGSSLQCNPNVVSFDVWITHEDCPPGVMIVEIDNENIAFSGTTFGSDPVVASGQSFTVVENVENGTAIGKIDLVSRNFFLPSDYAGDVYLVNALPGTPFSVATDGTISVSNSAAIDYETNKSFTLKIHADYVNRDSAVIDVVINVKNSNDNAPMQTQAIANIEVNTGDDVNMAVNNSFADIDGDGITFSSKSLPTGLTISNGGVITGSVDVAGVYQATLTANDGLNSTNVDLSIAVTADSTDSSDDTSNSAPNDTTKNEENAQVADDKQSQGGSTSFLVLILSSLMLMSRRVRR